MSYAKTLKQNLQNTQSSTNTNTTLPDKHQGIILDNVEDPHIEQYIYKIGEIVDPKHITHAAKIARNRVCIYFNNKNIVEHITNNYKFIAVDHNVIPIRPLVLPSQRLIISPVQPIIPDSLIENELKKIGIKLTTPIKPLRLGLKNDRFSHIYGFRRHVFIMPDDTIIYPDSIVVEHDSVPYRLFLSGEMIKCKLCNTADHQTNKCPQNNPVTAPTNNDPESSQKSNPLPTTSNPSSTTEKTDDANTPAANIAQRRLTPPPLLEMLPNDINDKERNEATSIDEYKNNVKNTPETMANTKTNKRSATSPISEPAKNIENELPNEHINIENKINVTEDKKKCIKKSRVEQNPANTPKITTEDMLAPLEREVENNPEKYPISFDELSELMDNIHGAADKINRVREYVEHIETLYDMLESLYPLLQHAAMKNRFTRLQKLLKANMTTDSQHKTQCDPDNNSIPDSQDVDTTVEL